MKSEKLKSILMVCVVLMTLTTMAFAGMRVIYTPGPPCNLRVGNLTETGFSLTYSPPKNDGGARVTGYLVEIQEGFWDFSWEPYRTVTGTKCAITNRVPRSRIYVRVRAENAAGIGEPSDVVEVLLPEVIYHDEAK